jgi:hypothetical protein
MDEAKGMDRVIGKCWTSKYGCASEVLDDLNSRW